MIVMRRTSVVPHEGDGAGIDERPDAGERIGLRAVERHDEISSAERHAPVQVAGMPAEPHRRLDALRPERQRPLCADPDHDCPARLDQHHRAVGERLAAFEAERTVGAAVGGEPQPAAAGLAIGNVEDLDRAAMRQCSDSEIRIISRRVRLRISESKEH